MCRYFKKAPLDHKHPMSQILLFARCPQHGVKLSKMDHFAFGLTSSDILALPSPRIVHSLLSG